MKKNPSRTVLRSFGSALLLAALAMPGTGVCASVAYLSPNQDAFTYNRTPDTNYGSDPQLAVGIGSLASYLWISYLSFGLSSIPADQTITSAVLYLYQVNGAGYGPIGTNLYHIANDGWTENGVTFNNQPTLGPVIAFNPDGYTTRGWSSWDLLASSVWNPAADVADGALSVAIGVSNSGDQTFNWCSRQSGLDDCLAPGESGPLDSTRRPYLLITYVPAPAGLWLFGTGLVALGARARKRRRV